MNTKKNKIISMENKACKNNCNGVYKEETIIDALYGDLHCTICGDKIKKYIVKK